MPNFPDPLNVTEEPIDVILTQAPQKAQKKDKSGDYWFCQVKDAGVSRRWFLLPDVAKMLLEIKVGIGEEFSVRQPEQYNYVVRKDNVEYESKNFDARKGMPAAESSRPAPGSQSSAPKQSSAPTDFVGLFAQCLDKTDEILSHDVNDVARVMAAGHIFDARVRNGETCAAPAGNDSKPQSPPPQDDDDLPF